MGTRVSPTTLYFTAIFQTVGLDAVQIPGKMRQKPKQNERGQKPLATHDSNRMENNHENHI